jgi:hypothetical protein
LLTCAYRSIRPARKLFAALDAKLSLIPPNIPDPQVNTPPRKGRSARQGDALFRPFDL